MVACVRGDTGIDRNHQPAADRSAGPRCPNCGASAPRSYCPECGQRQGPEVLSLRRWGERLLDEYLSLDGRFPRSLVSLLFRPGLLSREWFLGRRVRYSRPVRLFFLTGALFAATVVAAGGVQGEGSFLPRLMPILILAAVPLVALVVKWLERSADRTFVEHLVFTVHLQAFGFLILAALSLEAALKGAGTEGVELAEGPLWATYYSALSIWFTVYLVVAFRRAYDDSWGRAALNAGVLALAWSILVPVASGLLGGAVAGARSLLGI